VSQPSGSPLPPKPGSRSVSFVPSCVRARGGGEVWVAVLLNLGRLAGTLCLAGVLREQLDSR